MEHLSESIYGIDATLTIIFIYVLFTLNHNIAAWVFTALGFIGMVIRSYKIVQMRLNK